MGALEGGGEGTGGWQRVGYWTEGRLDVKPGSRTGILVVRVPVVRLNTTQRTTHPAVQPHANHFHFKIRFKANPKRYWRVWHGVTVPI